MKKIEKYLTEIFDFMRWDKTDIKESDEYITFLKEIKDKEEIQRLTSYDYEHIIDSLEDTFRIIFKNDKMLREIYVKKGYRKIDVLEYINSAINSFGYVNIEFKINKKEYFLKYSGLKDILNRFNFYSFMYGKNFIKWIQQFSFKDMENDIFSDKKQTIFFIGDSPNTLSNDKILIAGNNVDETLINNFSKRFDFKNDKKISKWRYDQVNWPECVKFINPTWFYFDFSNTNIDESIKKYFLKNTVDLVIPFISNYVIKDEKGLNCIINGHKKINITISGAKSYDQNQVYYLFEVYRWAYSGENTDKISILRKLITISLCEDCGKDYYSLIMLKSKNIYNTAVKNFDIYLKENVEQYFAARQKVMDLIENKSSDISNQINSIIANINKILIAFLGTIFTAIISSVQNLNITLIKVSLISLIGYIIIYGGYYLSYFKIRVRNIDNYYKEDIKKVNNNLLGFDPDDNSDKIYEMYYKRVDNNIKMFNIYWWISIVINILLICAAIFLIHNLKEVINTFIIK